jgi:hypothetical protein
MNPRIVMQNRARKSRQGQRQQLQKSDGGYIFPETKLLVLDALSREEKLSQDNFLAVIAPELRKENSNSKRRIDKNELIVHMDNSRCHNERKMHEYFARKKR